MSLPDLRNKPLTISEFLSLPESIAEKERYSAVYSGKGHKEIDPSCEQWANRTWLIYPDSRAKIIGYIGDKTGIRLSVECGEILEDK